VNKLGSLCYREIQKIFRDKEAFLYFFVLPFIGTLFFGYLYSLRTVNEIPVAVVYGEHTAGNRLIENYIDSSPTVKVKLITTSYQEAYRLFEREEVSGVIEIPRHMGGDLKHRKSVKLIALVDSRNLVVASTLMGALQKAVGFGQMGIKYTIVKKMLPSAEAMQRILPVRFVSHPLGNPAIDYGFFVLTGLFMMLIQQCLLVGSTVGVASEGEKGTLKETIGGWGNSFTYALGRSLSLLAVQTPINALLLLLYNQLFHMPLANLTALALFFTLFSFTVITFSQLLGALFPDRAAVFQFLVFFSMPAFFLGGYTWPSENMSLFAKFLSSLLPTTPLLNVFTRLTVLEGAVPFIGRFWLHQALLALAYLLLGTLALRLRSRRAPKIPQAQG